MTSMFQHRHYKAIADLLRKQRDAINAGAFSPETDGETAMLVKQSDRTIENFANMFSEDNPRFDRQRFKDAAFGDPRMHGKDKVTA